MTLLGLLRTYVMTQMTIVALVTEKWCKGSSNRSVLPDLFLPYLDSREKFTNHFISLILFFYTR